MYDPTRRAVRIQPDDLNSRISLEDEPFRVPFPSVMMKVVQDQYCNNQDARVSRHRELLCPFLGNSASRNDLIVASIENPLISDEDLSDVLALDAAEFMHIWEARPISMFDCLGPSCRAPITVRNRTHLLRLLRLDRYFGLRVGAGDPVEFKMLCEMLCESCAQGQWHFYHDQHRTDVLVRRSRIAQLSKMPFEEYRRTPEWRLRRNRVLLRAGNKCELCYESGLVDCHHRTYDRYGDELLSDLIALCRACHSRHHEILPEAA